MNLGLKSRGNEMKNLYQKSVDADDAFQAELQRQFGSGAVDMRYSVDKSEYDALTMSAYRKFRNANDPRSVFSRAGGVKQ